MPHDHPDHGHFEHQDGHLGLMLTFEVKNLPKLEGSDPRGDTCPVLFQTEDGCYVDVVLLVVPCTRIRCLAHAPGMRRYRKATAV